MTSAFTENQKKLVVRNEPGQLIMIILNSHQFHETAEEALFATDVSSEGPSSSAMMQASNTAKRRCSGLHK